jgi:hypothetical protein
MARYTKTAKTIKETHRVRQIGSVWSSVTMGRRIMVKDILEFADALREAEAPGGLSVHFEGHLFREAMTVEWTSETVPTQD